MDISSVFVQCRVFVQCHVIVQQGSPSYGGAQMHSLYNSERIRRKVTGKHENLGQGPRKESGFTGNRLGYAEVFILKASPDCLVRGNSACSLSN